MRYGMLFILFVFSSTILARDLKKVKIIGKTPPPLTSTQAQEIWKQIDGDLKNLRQQNCDKKIKLSQKLRSTTKKFKKISQFSRKKYEQHKYSFHKIKKQKYGQNNESLGSLLLDIQSILNSSYLKIKTKKGNEETCKGLQTGFLLAYASHYNMPDNKPVEQSMSPWAKRVHDSLKCLCLTKPTPTKPSPK